MAYRNYTRKSSTKSVKIMDEETSARFEEYCRLINKPASAVATQIISDYLKNSRETLYQQLSKEQLIAMLLQKEAVQDG